MMKKQNMLYIIPVFLFTTILIASDFNVKMNDKNGDVNEELQAVMNVSNNTENFNKMMDVLTHPRCINCHPNDNIPKQGEDSHPHYFGMSRGSSNLGFEATNCNTCHQEDNNDFSGVPGAPEWSLAPKNMKWEGLTRKEIAQSMMDKSRNGGRSPHEVMEHLTEHELVLWAWDPGINADGIPREKPPVPKDEYIKIVKEWFEAGAVIPE